MKLDIVVYSNKGALRDRKDMADLLRAAADVLEEMPRDKTRLTLCDVQSVRVGYLTITEEACKLDS